jgi:phosphatidylglycerophosphate synthase
VTGSALLFATIEAQDGGPAAVLPLEGGSTLLGRLVAQLDSLAVHRVTVVTRPAWLDEVRRALPADRPEFEVLPSADLAEDLRTAAAVAGRARGRLLVAAADILTHREALAGLLADPRVNTGILATGSWRRGRWAFRIRSQRGRIVSASSPYHRLRRPTGYFLNVLKVDARDVDTLAAAAGRMADAAAGEHRARWDAELERKAWEWRRRQWQIAVERETGVWPEAEEAPLDPPIDQEAEAELAERLRVSRDDVLSLLLVGLVRSGLHVSAAHLRNFFYARPLSHADLAPAEAELAEHDEDKVLLDAAVKGSDGFFTTYFVSPYSKYIARFAARRGWTPNQMTTVSLVIGMIAAACFALGDRAGLIAGAVLLQAAFTIDCVDGQLARYTRRFSKLGAWLDSVFDRSKEYIAYVGLAIGSTRGFGVDVWTLAACAITLQTTRHMVDFSFAAGRHEAIAATPQVPLEEPDELPGHGPVPAPAPQRVAAGVPALRPALAGSTGSPGASGGPPAGAVVTRASTVEDAPPSPQPPSGLPGLARRGVSVLGALERPAATRWARRIIALPIGERFALISITAAVSTPHTTFVALLGWGAVAATYSVSGRILRSVAR